MGKWLAGLFLFTLTCTAPPVARAQQTPLQQVEIILPPPLPVNMPVIQESEELSVQAYGQTMITEQCTAQRPVFWCKDQEGFLATRKAKILDAYEMALITRKVHQLFHYKADKVDTWRVHTSEVQDNKRWYGDCDDLASTTLDMLIRAGMPLDHVWFVLVSTENKTTLDHLVAMAEDKDGHYWIVGDTFFPSQYPVTEIKHRVLAVARGDTMLNWTSPELLGIFDPMTMVRPVPDFLKIKP